MALSTFDPAAALIVVDLQKGITALVPDRTVLDNSAALAAEFRARGLPVVLVNVDGGAPGRTEAAQPQRARPADWTELAPELDAQPGDIRVTKQRWGAFTGTDLHRLLQERGVTQTVLTGVATSIGVESTARSAHEHGYHVVLATDAMTDLDAEAHRHSVERIFPRLGETAATAEILAALRG
jgi:nicotinamidase-related amidase